MEKKNPWIAGLLNIVIPGSSELYVKQNRSGCIAISLMVLLSYIGLIAYIAYSFRQNPTALTPEKLALVSSCLVGLVILTMIAFFLRGIITAVRQNKMVDADSQALHTLTQKSAIPNLE